MAKKKKTNPFRVSTRRVYKVKAKRKSGKRTYVSRKGALDAARGKGVKVKDIKHNAPRTKIYGKCLRIEAQKTTGPYKGTKFFHNFTTKPNIYGLPNGDILISNR